MSVIEDSRKVLQDFIAPELRAIDARLSSLEKRFEDAQKHTDKRFEDMQKHTDQRFDAMQKHTDQRFDAMQKHTDQRFEDMQKHMDQRFDQIMDEIRRLGDIQEMKVRLARLEGSSHADRPAPASERLRPALARR